MYKINKVNSAVCCFVLCIAIFFPVLLAKIWFPAILSLGVLINLMVYISEIRKKTDNSQFVVGTIVIAALFVLCVLMWLIYLYGISFNWLLVNIIFVFISCDVYLCIPERHIKKEEIQMLINVAICILAVYARYAI